MQLKTKSVVLIAGVFCVILGASYLMFERLRGEVLSGLGTVYARKQVLYNRARTLQPLLRELALARKLADSSVLKEWARDEGDPARRAAALRELEDYRRFFSDGSYFFAVHDSGHYYYNDRAERYAGAQLRYTLDPEDPEDAWFYGTIASREAYNLNVDFDEKLQVTKVWMNVVVRDAGRPLGVVGTGLDLSAFLNTVVSSDEAGVSNLFVEGSGAIQAHDRVELIDFRSMSKDPSQRKTIFQLLDQEPDRGRLRAALDRLRSADPGTVEVLFAGLGGQRYLIGLTFLEEIGWYSLTLVDTERMLGAQRFVPFALLLLGALVLLCGALVLLLNRFLLNRIGRLDASVREFARGRLPLLPGAGPGDEMGRLEEGFQQMAHSVREHTDELEQRVADRTRELADRNALLEQALTEIRTLSGLLPTCMYCKKIRDEGGAWSSMEVYISRHSEAQFSHGICPDCLPRAYGDAGPDVGDGT